MKILLFFISLVAAGSLLLNVKLLLGEKSLRPKSFKVVEVIDGDTFKITSGKEDRRVRLIGVNAPEMDKCLSNQAREKLSELVLGKEVVLEDQFSDPYGRIMANVYVGKTYINREILASGLARLDYYENPKREELKTAYAKAREEKIGLFSTECLSLTPPISPISHTPCAIKGNVDENTQKKSYFLPTCKNYVQVTIDLSTNDQWFCTEEEAQKAGFSKSSTCD